jgi:hypothetical protein
MLEATYTITSIFLKNVFTLKQKTLGWGHSSSGRVVVLQA